MRPVVGITSYVEQARWGVWDVPAVVLPFRYVEQVEAAGATAVVLPPTASSDAEVLDRLDAVVFAGGADLDPALYDQPAHEQTTGLRPDRDAAEARGAGPWPAAPRDLPRHAGPLGGLRRRAGAAPARRGRPRAAPAGARR